MPRKPAPKRLPKLTDAERHKRFVEMAHEVEASDDPNEFDKAFKKVVRPRSSRNRSPQQHDEEDSRR
jgi:hypothetical protein